MMIWVNVLVVNLIFSVMSVSSNTSLSMSHLVITE